MIFNQNDNLIVIQYINKTNWINNMYLNRYRCYLTHCIKVILIKTQKVVKMNIE